MNTQKRRLLSALAATLTITVSAPALAQQVYSELTQSVLTKGTPSGKDDRLTAQGFSVVLLLGDMQGADPQETVPAAARRALADMKDFLPYKSYRLLDTQWILCCRGSGSAITRLSGYQQEYEVEIQSAPEHPGGLSIRFYLRETGDSHKPPLEKDKAPEVAREMLDREIFSLNRERQDLAIQVSKLRGSVEVGMGDPQELRRLDTQLALVTERIAVLQRMMNAPTPTKTPKAGSGAIIDTSFRMDIGETVVVGTSRLKTGGKALIALLTATPRPTSKETR